MPCFEELTTLEIFQLKDIRNLEKCLTLKKKKKGKKSEENIQATCLDIEQQIAQIPENREINCVIS